MMSNDTRNDINSYITDHDVELVIIKQNIT